MQQVGKVERRVIGVGSKSERPAIVLKTSDGHFVLRRVGGNAFQDQELERLVGQTVECEGDVHGGYMFLARKVTPVEG